MVERRKVQAPLEGFRILDLSMYLSGPMATRALADLGAEVIKVEPPGTGDPTRAGSGLAPGDPPSPYWVALHRDRRSVALDLKTEAGSRVLLDLVRAVDVVVENFRPGVAERLGIDPAALRAANPRLVTCRITGFGHDGPFSQLAAIDGPVQAFAGVPELTGDGETLGPPVPVQIADLAGASTATSAILAALLDRERTGEGRHVEISLLESLLQWLSVSDRIGILAPPATVVARGSDGLPFLVQAIMHFHDRFTALVAEVPGFEDLPADRRFDTWDGRKEHQAEYEDAIRRALATRPRDEWLRILHEAGVPAGPVHSIDEALDHPQVEHRGATTELELAGDERATVLAGPVRFDGARKRDTAAPPTLGEHTLDLLAEVGYGEDDLAELRRGGAFGDARVDGAAGTGDQTHDGR